MASIRNICNMLINVFSAYREGSFYEMPIPKPYQYDLGVISTEEIKVRMVKSDTHSKCIAFSFMKLDGVTFHTIMTIVFEGNDYHQTAQVRAGDNIDTALPFYIDADRDIEELTDPNISSSAYLAVLSAMAEQEPVSSDNNLDGWRI